MYFRKMKEILRTLILLLGRLLYSSHKSKIVYYHDVNPPSGKAWTDMSTPLQLFKQHIDIIRQEKYEIVRDIICEDDQVQVAFDDGFHGIYDNKDYFFSEDIKPTVFLATSLIGQPGYLNLKEILELQEHGFNFQCHTNSHANLTKLTHEELYSEVVESRSRLEKMLGKKIDSICFPQGYFSDAVLKVCREAGYNWIYSSIPGMINLSKDILPRNFCQTMSPFQFRLIINGGMKILKKHYTKLHYTH